MADLKIYTDGGARGNPGPAAIAILIFDGKDKLLFRHSEFIGTATNNVAEYRAVLKALTLAKRYGKKSVLCTMDSELVVSQLKGDYKVKKEHLLELFRQVRDLEKDFERVEYTHVKRSNEKISMADSMLNGMLDKVEGQRK